jgi:hypothetical protein
MKKSTKTQTPPSADFNALVSLMATHTEAHNDLGQLEQSVNRNHFALVNKRKSEYAELQEILTSTEKDIKGLVLRNPGWFMDARSIKTPFGVVKFHKATSLKVQNEELSIAKIKLRAEQAKTKAIQDNTIPAFAADRFLRTKEELDLEALEGLDDAELLSFGITRVTEDKFSVQPAAIDLGQAVKEASKTDAQPAKAA